MLVRVNIMEYLLCVRISFAILLLHLAVIIEQLYLYSIHLGPMSASLV